LAAGLAVLAAGEREVLSLHAWAELTYEQIAEGLRIPVGTVRSRPHRTRGVLRLTLELRCERGLEARGRSEEIRCRPMVKVTSPTQVLPAVQRLDQVLGQVAYI
jgi:Sigma-70, region 4